MTSDKLNPCNFIAVFIMSHGGKIASGDEFIESADHKRVKTKDILRLFDNDKAPKYQGIPKLVFFQCCRGSTLDQGVEDVTSAMARAQIGSYVQTDDGGRWLPTSSDILVAYSTHNGFKSFRNEQLGSWFISAIVNVFSKWSHQEHVLDMMTCVNYAVKEMSGRVQTGELCKAMSEVRHCLTKKLYLMPGHTATHF